jgi:hypothetical protein
MSLTTVPVPGVLFYRDTATGRLVSGDGGVTWGSADRPDSLGGQEDVARVWRTQRATVRVSGRVVSLYTPGVVWESRTRGDGVSGMGRVVVGQGRWFWTVRLPDGVRVIVPEPYDVTGRCPAGVQKTARFRDRGVVDATLVK